MITIKNIEIYYGLPVLVAGVAVNDQLYWLVMHVSKKWSEPLKMVVWHYNIIDELCLVDYSVTIWYEMMPDFVG